MNEEIEIPSIKNKRKKKRYEPIVQCQLGQWWSKELESHLENSCTQSLIEGNHNTNVE